MRSQMSLFWHVSFVVFASFILTLPWLIWPNRWHMSICSCFASGPPAHPAFFVLFCLFLVFVFVCSWCWWFVCFPCLCSLGWLVVGWFFWAHVSASSYIVFSFVDCGSGFVRHTRARLYSRSSKVICFLCLHGIPTLSCWRAELERYQKYCFLLSLVFALAAYTCTFVYVCGCLHTHSFFCFLWCTCVIVYDGIYNLMCPWRVLDVLFCIVVLLWDE